MKRLVVLLACGVALALTVPAAAFAGGVVKGTVTPIEWAQEVEVCVVEAQPSEACTAPAADGSYTLLEVPFGGARIEFVPSFRSRLLKQYYDDASTLSTANPVVLSAAVPEVSGVDADLAEGGAIGGKVTSVGGEPLAEVEVCAIGQAICDETGPAGEYELHSLPGGSYGIVFRGRGASDEYESLTHPAVEVGTGVTTAGVDAALAKGARVEGAVTSAADGAPLGGVVVCLFAPAAASAQRCVETDAGGAYAFQGLPGGSYQVGFGLGTAEISGTGTTAEVGGYAPQFFAAASTRAAATTISLLTAQTVAGVNAALAPPPPAPAPAAVAAVSTPIVAPASTIAEPKPKPSKVTCKKGYRKKKVKGTARCVKTAKSKPRRHKKKSEKSKKIRRPRSNRPKGSGSPGAR
jgi:Carboxypeptidase regulatory-like domain